MKYKLIFTDSKHKLQVELWDNCDDQNYVLDVKITSKFIVYHALLDRNKVDLIPTDGFETQEDAFAFANGQYYLRTGRTVMWYIDDTPCFSCIDLDEVGETCRFTKPDNYISDYIIISNGLIVETYPLAVNAVW